MTRGIGQLGRILHVDVHNRKIGRVAWRAAGRIIGFSLVGGVVLALAGFLEALIVFPAFMTVHRRLFPTAGTDVMTAMTSGLPGMQAALGIVLGAITFAILGIPRSRQHRAATSLARPLIDAGLGTSAGAVMGGLGGLALAGRLAESPQALLMGYFYGSLFGFLLGLVIAAIASSRRNGAVHA